MAVQRDDILQLTRSANTLIRLITAADPKMNAPGGGLSVTPDGKWLLYTRNDQDVADVLVLDHFR